jgi:hypothetical protein
VLEGLPDPTTLICRICRAEYALNEARVVKALRTAVPEDQKLAQLCWICAHLKRGAEQERMKS